MTDSFSTASLRTIFKFPFQAPDWQSRFLIGVALLLAGMFVPIVPALFVYGYLVRVLRQATLGEPPTMPKWDNWGQLAIDGLRSLVVGLIYLGPGILIMIGGWVLYMVMWVGGITLSVSGSPREDPSGIGMALIIGAIASLFISMFLGWFLAMVGSILFPAALTHFAARDKLGAALNVRAWGSVVRADKWGYFISWVVTLGLAGVMYFAVTLVYLTGILCFLAYFVAAPLGFYVLLVAAAMFGQHYHEGAAQLNPALAPQPSEPVEPPAPASDP